MVGVTNRVTAWEWQVRQRKRHFFSSRDCHRIQSFRRISTSPKIAFFFLEMSSLISSLGWINLLSLKRISFLLKQLQSVNPKQITLWNDFYLFGVLLWWFRRSIQHFQDEEGEFRGHLGDKLPPLLHSNPHRNHQIYQLTRTFFICLPALHLPVP